MASHNIHGSLCCLSCLKKLEKYRYKIKESAEELIDTAIFNNHQSPFFIGPLNANGMRIQSNRYNDTNKALI